MKNINTNISSVYAILGMFPVLVITGILLLISYHAQILAGGLKEQIAIELILADSLTAAETESLFTKVQQQPFTRKAKFVSKYQAAQELQKELGQDFMDILGFNPLYSKIDVFVKEEYASPAQLQNIKNNLASTPGVLEINVPLQIASVIDKIVKQLYWFFGALGTLMLLGAVLQIFNTIRLAVFSNRNIIRSMLLVGATR
ncbi:MAG: permease-like cell division protein FtsX, partial [Chitinophagales bacterium]|nr:permease-like cell division protein FtsX [Chitinophagales bacterium]